MLTTSTRMAGARPRRRTFGMDFEQQPWLLYRNPACVFMEIYMLNEMKLNRLLRDDNDATKN
jgi:hypothetical protein